MTPKANFEPSLAEGYNLEDLNKSHDIDERKLAMETLTAGEAALPAEGYVYPPENAQLDNLRALYPGLIDEPDGIENARYEVRLSMEEVANEILDEPDNKIASLSREQLERVARLHQEGLLTGVKEPRMDILVARVSAGYAHKAIEQYDPHPLDWLEHSLSKSVAAKDSVAKRGLLRGADRKVIEHGISLKIAAKADDELKLKPEDLKDLAFNPRDRMTAMSRERDIAVSHDFLTEEWARIITEKIEDFALEIVLAPAPWRSAELPGSAGEARRAIHRLEDVVRDGSLPDSRGEEVLGMIVARLNEGSEQEFKELLTQIGDSVKQDLAEKEQGDGPIHGEYYARYIEQTPSK